MSDDFYSSYKSNVDLQVFTLLCRFFCLIFNDVLFPICGQKLFSVLIETPQLAIPTGYSNRSHFTISKNIKFVRCLNKKIKYNHFLRNLGKAQTEHRRWLCIKICTLNFLQLLHVDGHEKIQIPFDISVNANYNKNNILTMGNGKYTSFAKLDT